MISAELPQPRFPKGEERVNDLELEGCGDGVTGEWIGPAEQFHAVKTWSCAQIKFALINTLSQIQT